MPTSTTDQLKRLPSVSRVLAGAPVQRQIRRFGAGLVTQLLRETLEALRERIRNGGLPEPEFKRLTTVRGLAAEVGSAAEALLDPRPRPVINATGIVVHTNLGRSILSAETARQVAETASGYSDLEYDVEAGHRGSRMGHLDALMQRLFPGHGFLVVNNNAAAILLCLQALARQKQVLISRGELVEIGGAFRVPDIMSAAGARLCEVGTTNRTRLADYRRAITPKSAMILKVHTSNFRIVGFTEETTVTDLAKLATQRGIPLVVDWGSGDLVDLQPLGIRDEIPIGRILAAGADLVTFSGDKLLGGPQAGFVVGRQDLIDRLRRHPLARVCRLDRLLVAALHRTLAAYVGGNPFEEIPTLRMLSASAEEIGKRARRVLRAIGGGAALQRRLQVIDGISRTGGGSSPVGERPTKLLAVSEPSGDAGGLERALRQGSPPVIGRLQDGRLLLDLRTVLPDQEETLVARLRESLRR